ncbi:conserved protein of unknown function [Thauera humireducens]|uniref:PEP-CTERM/exosortase system-associated acyltransferase n=1 Tax=Thauera TaxID=33057 RepID=UPI0002CF0237|nr:MULTISPECIES: PEP-CTERM/exosortase system-associated acyltransferase [Thauera]ENO77336.1 hypothetical protein C664_12000 [Thauera sp. 63]CAH1746199.1 conserved protein of unknown function [Thauera humireducens]
MSLSDNISLGHKFRQYFRIGAALDDDLRRAVFSIRHEVYCEDLHFEPEHPDRLETDPYDAHSLHCLMQRVGSPGDMVGCTRLVLTDPESPFSLLPFEETCSATINRSIVDPMTMPRGRIAEVSRLAVRRMFRHRKGEDRSSASVRDEDFGVGEHPRFPYIPIGLYMGAIALAARSGIDVLFVLTEPRLTSHFARLGVNIRQIGDPVSHRGTRVPSMLDVQETIREMRPTMRPLWREIHRQIECSYAESSFLHQSCEE